VVAREAPGTKRVAVANDELETKNLRTRKKKGRRNKWGVQDLEAKRRLLKDERRRINVQMGNNPTQPKKRGYI
jgi:hypothetical protein